MGGVTTGHTTKANRSNGHQKGERAMNPIDGVLSRRNLLRGGLALGASALFVRGAYAEELERTPSVTEGPFYPPKLPLDTDNDLLIINDHITPAVGEVTHLSGRVLSTSGSPLRNVLVEIWQCDGNGVYLAQGDGERRDSNFQGFGRFLTSSTGEYYFRTIKPVPYPGRTPHIHLKLKQGGRELLTTQFFINGHPLNRTDGIFQDVGGPLEKELVLVDFKPLEGTRTGELVARMDLVLGRTPAEPPRNERRRRPNRP
jgi:protocatechuate 3,4-dioxygenase, beta subunit